MSDVIKLVQYFRSLDHFPLLQPGQEAVLPPTSRPFPPWCRSAKCCPTPRYQ